MATEDYVGKNEQIRVAGLAEKDATRQEQPKEVFEKDKTAYFKS